MKFKFYCFFLFILAWSCQPDGKEFNESIWKKYEDNVWIHPHRYAMTRWLKKHYSFCDKTQEDIIAKLGSKGAYINYADSTSITYIKYIIKQHNNNFIIGIDPPSDMAYLVVYFYEENVNKVVVEERKNKEDIFREVDIIYLKE